MTTERTTDRKTVDVFTAGCPLCDAAVETVRSLVGDDADVRVLDTHNDDLSRTLREAGIEPVLR